MVPSTDSDSLLARHEAGVFDSCRKRLALMAGHRSADFGRFILPQAVRLVESIGHRIAYDAAVSLGVDQRLVDLYVASCVKLDAAWYAEHANLSQDAQLEMESTAIEAVLPSMWDLIEAMGVSGYAIAPIASEDGWDKMVTSLETFHHKELYVSRM
ncbi:hypothetical protein B0H16DRAFT_1505588 [Mycena metata]|uniref:Uncharacterized protein n=1 Tax=Mycena metata TaxID=1033252 RepID=A0AAD7K3H4_9AGAR|nr:hypothetical protein B0H16DRAFT_1505588 [Mycena metata]